MMLIWLEMLSCITCIGTELPATLGLAPGPPPPPTAAQEDPKALPPRSLSLRLPRALEPDPVLRPIPALLLGAAGSRTPARPSASAMPTAGCAAAATASSCAAMHFHVLDVALCAYVSTNEHAR